MEGIFPRSYVNVMGDKGTGPPPASYGNMPLEVSQSGSTPVTTIGPDGKQHTKFEEHGKKFGKKMGNAGTLSIDVSCLLCKWMLTILAIFGAGATIGSNIVNSVF